MANGADAGAAKETAKRGRGGDREYGPILPGRTFASDGAGGWREANDRDLFLFDVLQVWAANGLTPPPEIMRAAAQEYDNRKASEDRRARAEARRVEAEERAEARRVEAEERAEARRVEAANGVKTGPSRAA